MKKLVIATVLSLSMVITALAQQPAPEYVPFTVSKDDYEGLVKYLQKQPWEVAQPIMQWLIQAEAQAQTQARAAKAAQEKTPTAPIKKD